MRGARVGRVVLCALLAASPAAGQLRPPELVARVAALGLQGPILRFCPAEFQKGRGGFAIAVRAPNEARGRYLALTMDGPAIDLGTFDGDVDLACYSREQSLQLNAAITASAGAMRGAVAPRWDGAIVCGFVEPTRAVCWQWDPAASRFVEVGGWTT